MYAHTYTHTVDANTWRHPCQQMVDHDSSPGEARGTKVDDTVSTHMLSRHLIHTTTARWQEGIPLVRTPQAPSTVHTQIITDFYLPQVKKA